MIEKRRNDSCGALINLNDWCKKRLNESSPFYEFAFSIQTTTTTTKIIETCSPQFSAVSKSIGKPVHMSECKCCTMKVKCAQGINKIFIPKAFLSVAMLLSQKKQMRSPFYAILAQDICSKFQFFSPSVLLSVCAFFFDFFLSLFFFSMTFVLIKLSTGVSKC